MVLFLTFFVFKNLFKGHIPLNIFENKVINKNTILSWYTWKSSTNQENSSSKRVPELRAAELMWTVDIALVIANALLWLSREMQSFFKNSIDLYLWCQIKKFTENSVLFEMEKVCSGCSQSDRCDLEQGGCASSAQHLGVSKGAWEAWASGSWRGSNSKRLSHINLTELT